MRTAFLISALAGLAACSDVTGPALVSLTVTESFVRPALETISGPDYVVFRNRITLDVDAINASSESVWLSGCNMGSTAPAMLLERADARPSALQVRLVCQSAPSFEVPAGSTVRFAYTLTSDIFCSVNSDCLMAEPDTWGYHRLEISTERGAVYSNRFAISSPLIYD